MHGADTPENPASTRVDTDRREALLRAIVGVQSAFMANADAPIAFREMLGHLEHLTGARGVLIAEVPDADGPEPAIRTLALTDISWDAESRRIFVETGGFGIVLPTRGSLLGDVVRSKAPVFRDTPHDDGLGMFLPRGHPPITNYLGMPALTNGRLTGIVALINRPTPFDERDVEFLQPLVLTLAQLIESRRASDQLTRERRELAVLSEVARQMPVGAVLTTATGSIEWINPALEQMTGRSLVEMQGQRPVDLLLSPSADDGIRAQIDAAMSRASGFTIDMPCRRRDGSEFWVEATAHPLGDPDEGNTRYVTLVVDIDERRRGQLLERERDQADARTEAQARFLAAMSHELRTPLNAVVGFHHLLSQTPLTERQQHLLQRASEAAGLLLANISDVLDFSRLEAGALQAEEVPTSIAGVLDEVCSVADVLAMQRGLEFRRQDGPGSSLTVLSDPVRLKQLLLNLLGNAVKFTESGFVSLTTTARLDAAGSVVMAFSVSDTGIGIDEDRLADVFHPFRQAESSTTRRFGGTGLGLAICHRIAEAMGGTIRLTSRVGEGSIFDVEIPARLVPDVSHEQSDATQPINDPAGVGQSRAVRLEGVRILVAEDNEFNGEIIVDLLGSAGATVTLVTDGQQAVDAMRNGGRFDILLLDVQMPVMDGLAATRTILAERLDGGAPIVALTANAQAEDRDRCIDAGMTEIIVKPVDPHRLLSTLRLLIGH
jgi:PAS domain S-box-containing protein